MQFGWLNWVIYGEMIDGSPFWLWNSSNVVLDSSVCRRRRRRCKQIRMYYCISMRVFGLLLRTTSPTACTRDSSLNAIKCFFSCIAAVIPQSQPHTNWTQNFVHFYMHCCYSYWVIFKMTYDIFKIVQCYGDYKLNTFRCF